MTCVTILEIVRETNFVITQSLRTVSSKLVMTFFKPEFSEGWGIVAVKTITCRPTSCGNLASILKFMFYPSKVSQAGSGNELLKVAVYVTKYKHAKSVYVA
jgi:hypothetical protein